MTVPELVRERLGEGSPRARIPLQGENELVVGDDRTLLYRAEGLLSGESIEEFSHEAESVSVNDGRRKSTIRLDQGIDGTSEFSIPSDSLEEALPPLLGGVLAAADVIDPDEDVEVVFRLGELTVVVTEGRVIKHVGSATWDHEAEVYAFQDVTGLDMEEGDVSSQVIVEVAGRPQRIKAPTEDARAIKQRIERALLSYYEVESYPAFLDAVGEPEPEPEPAEEADDEDGAEDQTAGDEEAADDEDESTDDAASEVDDFAFEGVDVEGEEETVVEELAALREAVERQNELLETHQRIIEALVEELREERGS